MALLAMPACADRSLDAALNPLDLTDHHTLRLHIFEPKDPEYRSSLRRRELPFRLVSSEAGDPLVQIWSTDAYAETLRSIGLEPLGSVRDLPHWTDRLRSRQSSSSLGHKESQLSLLPPKPLSAGEDAGSFDDLVGKPYDDSHGILARMQSLANLDYVTYHALGTTYENRTIGAVKFGPWGDPPAEVPTVVIAGTYHAREWIGTVVAQDLIEALADAFDQQAGDLYQALENAAVVVVPVVNPDGYQYSITNDRMWRTNRNLTSCRYGVDPNRNHHPTALWRSTPCISEVFPGPAPGSDAEAQAIENLLEGQTISGLKPVAFISYHSYGNLLLYPAGYAATGTMACSLNGAAEGDERYCYNPDFQLYRELFGDTDSTLFNQPRYYYRDHGDSLLYLAQGDSNLYGQYQAHVLSVLPELPYDGFTRFEELLWGVTADQRAVLKRVADAAPALVSSSYGFGSVGPAWGARELQDRHAGAQTSVRFSLLLGAFIPANSGILEVKPNGASSWQPLSSSRSGIHFRLFQYEPEDPLRPPCWVDVRDPETGATGRVATPCDNYVDFCSQDRLDANGWQVVAANRGGVPDCYWQPTESVATLEIPGGDYPTEWLFFWNLVTTRCYMSFSAVGLSDVPLTVSRKTPAGAWRELYTTPQPYPYFDDEKSRTRHYSYTFEANSLLPDAVPAFKITAINAQSSEVKVFDPVVYCWVGEAT